MRGHAETVNVYEYIKNTILKLMPPEAQITKIEFEGPEIAIYVKNVEAVIKSTDIIKKIAKTIKKRVVIRTDPAVRKSEEETKEIITRLIPKEADIKSLEFDHTLGEIIIKTSRPGLVIGKGGNLLRKILLETGWRPNIVRAPPRETITLTSILQVLLAKSEYRINVLRSIGHRIHRPVLFRNNYVRVTALGGFREVGRAAILVETAETKVLLDVGLNPGASHPLHAYPRFDTPEFDVSTLDAVIVTHAHLDHCGLVPYLFKYGYEGPVYVTKATRDLMVLMQKDLLEIAARENKYIPYTIKEVRKMLLHTIPLNYGEVTDIAPDVRVTLYNAGHILGSAMVHLHVGEGLHNIVYTGDFKYGRTRLLPKANDRFPRVETLIMESTYGTDYLPPRDEAERELIDKIKKVIEHKGKVLVPVFAVGRGQEVMLVILHAMKKGLLPKIPIYVDGMIDEVTALHATYPELLSDEVREAIYRGENPFNTENIKKVEHKDERRAIVDSDEPAIILATSGMLTGGPSVEYLKMMAKDEKNALIFVSYQVEGTLGRKIKDGQREIITFTPEGKVEVLKIKLKVFSVEGFSGHSDRRQLLAFLNNVTPRPERVILYHGEESKTLALANTIRRMGFETYAPRILDSIRIA